MTDIQLVFAFVIAVLAVGRLTRLLTYDSYPPTAAIRRWWDSKTDGSGWNELLHCPYCAAPYLALPVVVIFAGVFFGWGVFLTLAGIWWVFCAVLAVGYAAAIIVATNWG